MDRSLHELVMVMNIWGKSKTEPNRGLFGSAAHSKTLGCLQFQWFEELAELTLGLFAMSAKCLVWGFVLS